MSPFNLCLLICLSLLSYVFHSHYHSMSLKRYIQCDKQLSGHEKVQLVIFKKLKWVQQFYKFSHTLFFCQRSLKIRCIRENKMQKLNIQAAFTVLIPAHFLWFSATRVCHGCLCSPLLTASQQGRRTPCCCRSSRRIWMPAFSTHRRTSFWSRLSVRTGRWCWWWTASSQSPGWTQHQCQETRSLTRRPNRPSPLPSVLVSSSSPLYPWPTALQLLPMLLLPAWFQLLQLQLLQRRRGFILLLVFHTVAWILLQSTHSSKAQSCHPALSRLPCVAHLYRPHWLAGAFSTAHPQPHSCHLYSSPLFSRLYPHSSSLLSSLLWQLQLQLLQHSSSSSHRLSSRPLHLNEETSIRAHRLFSQAAWVEMSDTYRPPNHHCHMTHLWGPDRTQPQGTLWPPSHHQRRQRSRELICRVASAPQCPSGLIYSARCRQELCPQCVQLRPQRRRQWQQHQHRHHHPQPSTGNPPDLEEILFWAVQRLSKTKCVLHQIYDPIFHFLHLSMLEFIFKNGYTTKELKMRNSSVFLFLLL